MQSPHSDGSSPTQRLIRSAPHVLEKRHPQKGLSVEGGFCCTCTGMGTAGSGHSMMLRDMQVPQIKVSLIQYFPKFKQNALDANPSETFCPQFSLSQAILPEKHRRYPNDPRVKGNPGSRKRYPGDPTANTPIPSPQPQRDAGLIGTVPCYVRVRGLGRVGERGGLERKP